MTVPIEYKPGVERYRAAAIGLTGIGAEATVPAATLALGERTPHSHVGAYALDARTDVVAVCDLQPDRIAEFRSLWGDRYPRAAAYQDYREMLARERIDLLSVVTPDHRHASIVLDAAAAGVRGILCEKPIATTLAEADRMIDACVAASVPLLIDHTRRWFPEWVQARDLLRSGEIGTLRRVVATLGGPRAMLFRNGTHLIDMVCYFTEAGPVWLVAVLDDEHRAYPPRYAGDGGRDAASDPGGSAYIHFSNGVRAFVNASKGTPPNFEIDLIGTTGRQRIGTHVAELSRVDERDRLMTWQVPHPRTTRASIPAAVAELIDLVKGRQPPTTSAREARLVLSILLGILQSNAGGSSQVNFPIADA